MIKYRSIGLHIVLLVLLISKSQGSFFQDFSYDDAWKKGEMFNGYNLRKVIRLYPNHDNQLIENENEMSNALLHSETLTNLKSLDLSNQGINDDFIEVLCNNSTFSRVINLDLSGNIAITARSLEVISASDILGSIRDLPQISGRYGIPSSEIRIETKGTGISSSIIKEYEEKPKRFDFSIKYLHPVHEYPTSRSVSNAIKWLQFR